MQIIKQMREYTPLEKAVILYDNNTKSIKDLEDNFPISVKDYILYSDIDKDENETKVLVIGDISKQDFYATNSATFIDMFLEYAGLLIDDYGEVNIIKLSGTSKNGRKFVTCNIDFSAYKK